MGAVWGFSLSPPFFFPFCLFDACAIETRLVTMGGHLGDTMFKLAAKTTLRDFTKTHTALCRAVPSELKGHKAIFVRFAQDAFTSELSTHDIAHALKQADGWLLTNSVFACENILSVRVARQGGAMHGWEFWAKAILDEDAVVELMVQVETEDGWVPMNAEALPGANRKDFPHENDTPVETIKWAEGVLASVNVPTRLVLNEQGNAANLECVKRAAFDAARKAFVAAGAPDVLRMAHTGLDDFGHLTILILGKSPKAFELGIEIDFGRDRIFFASGLARRAA